MATPSDPFNAITPIPPKVTGIAEGIFAIPSETGEPFEITTPASYRLYMAEYAPEINAGFPGDWYIWSEAATQEFKVYQKQNPTTWKLILTIPAGSGGTCLACDLIGGSVADGVNAGNIRAISEPSGSVTGDVRGLGSVDLQQSRSSSNQVAGGIYSVISGGVNNRAIGAGASVGGGQLNLIVGSGSNSRIGGGYGNSVSAAHSVIAGGLNNGITAGAAFIGGGSGNTITSVGLADSFSVIGGGNTNSIAGSNSFIGGGSNNAIASGANYSTISGGYQHQSNGLYSTIGGGWSNISRGTGSTVAGGVSCIANSGGTTGYGSVIGGFGNSVASNYGSGLGGRQNLVNTLADYASASGWLAAAARPFERVHANGQTSAYNSAYSAHTIITAKAFTFDDSTATDLTLDGAAPGSTNRIKPATGAGLIADLAGTINLIGTVVGSIGSLNAAASTHAHYLFRFLVAQSSSPQVVVEAIGTQIDDGTVVSITWDAVNSAIKITVTGTTTTAMVWHAVIDSINVTAANSGNVVTP